MKKQLVVIGIEERFNMETLEAETIITCIDNDSQRIYSYPTKGHNIKDIEIAEIITKLLKRVEDNQQ